MHMAVDDRENAHFQPHDCDPSSSAASSASVKKCLATTPSYPLNQRKTTIHPKVVTQNEMEIQNVGKLYWVMKRADWHMTFSKWGNP
jgi:hypothetical protein